MNAIKATIPTLLAIGLAGCINFGPRQVVEPVRNPPPSVVVNAAPSVVRGVIIDSARERGSAIAQVGDGLVLERPLDQSNATVVAQCGAHRPGRQVRVVLRAIPEGAGRTMLIEERYIVDGGAACQLDLIPADRQQALSALGRIRGQAEASGRGPRVASF